ncbi:MAG: RNA methyltransferase [Verrucomicrobiae bacterium]|nr:RNA methyltransferase [Verrucomicrobiae bacterium]
MLRVRPIDSLDLPELAPYRTLRQPHDHYRERYFVAEGATVVRRLIESDLTLFSVLLPEDRFEPLRPALEARPETIDAFIGPMPLLETMTGFNLYQGVLACARIPPPAELDVAFAMADRPRFFVATDELANAENLGGLLRTAAGLGAHALLVGETCAHPYLRRSVRASMGALFSLPVVEPVSLVEALRELSRRGVRCVGAHPHATGITLPEADLRGDCCIVLGSEGHGLRPAVRDVCDVCVALPMHHGVDSLNVAAAGAVFLYEVWRQRQSPPASASQRH